MKIKVSMSTAILKTKDVLNAKSLHMLYCSLILHDILCGNMGKHVQNRYKQNILQKRAIRIINRTEYIEPANTLFINSNALKLRN